MIKHKIFTKLSRRKRRSLVIDLKNKMRNEAKEYGGKFLSDCLFNSLDKEKEYKRTRHWIDVYFPSKKDPSILWNATIITCLQDFDDNIERDAFDKASSKLTTKEIDSILDKETIPVFGKNGDIIAEQEIYKEQEKKDIFDGRTYYEEIDFQKENNIEENVLEIRERYEVYKDYVYGIGITIVVDEDHLNQQAVERAIEDFYRRGEKEWVSDELLDKKELTKRYREVFLKTYCNAAYLKID